jgi:hypothetical protein
VLPLAKHKTYYYAQILGVGYLAYLFGFTTVSTITGDVAQTRYLKRYQNQIIAGTMPFEKPKE